MKDESARNLDEALLRLREAPYDDRAWATVYTVLWPHVYTIAFRCVQGATDLAQDASQEVFLRLLRAGPAASFENAAALRAYLSIAARRVVIDVLRSRYRWPEVELDSTMHFINQHDDVEEELSVQQSLALFLEHLGPSEQQMIKALVSGHSISEIAEDLDISPGAARVRLHRLRQRLSVLYGRDRDSQSPPSL